MKKKPQPKRKRAKVIPINRAALQSAEASPLSVSDVAARRMIINVGGERFAYDVTARITELPPLGGRAALVMPRKTRKGD